MKRKQKTQKTQYAAAQQHNALLHSWNFSPREHEEHTLIYGGDTVPVVVAGVAGGSYKPGFTGEDVLCRASDESCYYLVRTIEPARRDQDDPSQPRARRTRIKRLSIRGGLLYALGYRRPRLLRQDFAELLPSPTGRWCASTAGGPPVPTARQRRLLTRLARVFGMSIPDFWKAYDRRELPGQQEYRGNDEEMFDALSDSITFKCSDPEMTKRLKSATSMNGYMVDEYVARWVAEGVRCDEEDYIWHPKTGEIIGSRQKLANLERRGPLVLPA